MSDEFDRSRFEAALGVVDDWPVDNVSAAVVGPEGALAVRGDRDRVYRLASVTKPIVAVAALLAIEEEAISLDEPAGPEGSTVRHLLAHASGLDFGDRDKVRTGPGERRIYSSAGFEVLADHITEATGIAFTDYLDEAVCRPLGMGSTVLEGSPGHGASGSLADLIAFAGELVAPRLLAAETLDEATAEQFGGINGVVPGYGMQKPCPWGLGFELRGAKHPHWTGQHNSPGTFGHFGQSGTLLWVEPEISTDADPVNLPVPGRGSVPTPGVPPMVITYWDVSPPDKQGQHLVHMVRKRFGRLRDLPRVLRAHPSTPAPPLEAAARPCATGPGRRRAHPGAGTRRWVRACPPKGGVTWGVGFKRSAARRRSTTGKPAPWRPCAT